MFKVNPFLFRPAKPSDMDGIVALALASHTESRFNYITFSAEKVRKLALNAMGEGESDGLMLATRRGNIAGAVFCSIGELHIGSGTLLTTVRNINVDQKYRAALMGGYAAMGLLKGVETWSRIRGASEILFHVSSGIELVRGHKFISRIGYEFVGGNYAKTI